MGFSTISKNNNDAWILQARYTMQARVRNNINIQGKTFIPPILSSILIIHKTSCQNPTIEMYLRSISFVKNLIQYQAKQSEKESITYLQKQFHILFQNAQKQGQDIILSSPLLVFHYAQFLIDDNLLDEALQVLAEGIKTHPNVANFCILYSRVIYLVELLNNENEDCNISPHSTNDKHSHAITLLMKACHILPIKPWVIFPLK